MNAEFLRSYFQAIANKLKFIGPAPDGKENFFLDDIDNPNVLNEMIKRSAVQTILLVELPDDWISGNGYDNNTQGIESAFSVLTKVSAKDKVSDRNLAKEQCKLQGRKIAHMMLQDALMGDLEANNILFKLDSKGFGIGPVADGYYGWRYNFSWRAPEVTKINPEDWFE